jgi:hypothetical protein
VRVVRLANYVAPASGGLRTSLRELGAGYLAAGHEPVLVIPGARPGRQLTEQGLVVTVPGWRVPATGGTGPSWPDPGRPQTITAVGPLLDDLRQALEAISHASRPAH